MPSTPLATQPPPSPAASSAPVMRIIAVPDAAPPYDCDTHGARCQPARATKRASRGTTRSGNTDGQARSKDSQARSKDSRAHGTDSRAHGTDSQLRGPGGQAQSARKAADVRVPPPRQESPAAARMTAAWPGQFAQVIIEILGGSRPPRQLIPLTTERSRAQLEPYLAAGQRPEIKRVLAFRPSERVVEMTVIVSFGGRARALAMRLEHVPARPAAPGRPTRPARWICTEVETG